MCRMILAVGQFSVKSVLNAALHMSEGLTANHETPLKLHRDGWGTVWRDRRTGRLLVHRDVRSIAESLYESPLFTIDTDVLAVHVRRATLASTKGLEFTHPITRKDTLVPWFLMHNGFLPTVYREIGLERSVFDTAEYFDYIIPGTAYELDRKEVVNKLERLAPNGVSANAIIINPRRAYALEWFPRDSEYRDYYTMQQLKTKDTTYIASEVILELGRAESWSSIGRGELIEFSL